MHADLPDLNKVPNSKVNSSMATGRREIYTIGGDENLIHVSVSQFNLFVFCSACFVLS